MRRLLPILATTIIILATLTTPAHAATHAPCVGHIATTPHVTLLLEGTNTIIEGSGAITGCPVPIGTETVTLTVTLQHQEQGEWVDYYTKGPTIKGWSRYYRYARQHSLTVNGPCLVGDWRTHVTGGDGYQPTSWDSTTATFVPGDSGVCGSYGGGD